MIQYLIKENYNITIDNIDLIDSHFGTEIFLLKSGKNKYILKSLPVKYKDLEDEGDITDFLHKNGIPTARFLKTKNNNYAVKTNEIQFHIQEFIEGSTFAVNSAPDWFLIKSAQTLGKIQNILTGYKPLNRSFDDNFFQPSTIISKRDHLQKLLETKEAKSDKTLTTELIEQIKHANKLLTFKIDPKRLTYTNSHGDYWIGQMINQNENITVIDWSSACCLPACNEVIMSYTFADPTCKNGEIAAHKLKKYLENYSQYFSLNQYDIEIMPYVFYWRQFMTNYTPPFSSVPQGYKDVSKLINNVLSYLYKNADELSSALRPI